MKAIVYHQYGGTEKLEIREVENPLPKDDEVLIKVYSVSINDWDFGLLQGDFVNRMMNGVFKPGKKILGSDVAGKITAVGKNIKTFKPGDDVYGDLSGKWGGFAEYVCANEKSVVLKPADMSFDEAAAIPQAGMLAVQGLIDIGKIKKGQKILINGAGGGVGTFGVQIAKLFHAEVTGVDSASKFDMMRSLGFDHLIDYTKEDFTESGIHYDLILDAKTNRSVFDYLKVLTPGGTYATVGGAIGTLLQTATIGRLISRMKKKNLRVVALKPNKDLEYFNKLFNERKMKSVIDGPYLFKDFLQAFKLFEKGQHKGKVVISVIQ